MTSKKRVFIGIVLLVVVALVSMAVGAERAAVQIRGNAFSPSTTTVVVGDSVQWTNNDNTPHTVTADTNAFHSNTLQRSQGFTQTFDRVGTIPYHCAIHPSMTGRVIVVDVADDEGEETGNEVEGEDNAGEEPAEDPGTTAGVNEFLRSFFSLFGSSPQQPAEGTSTNTPDQQAGLQATIEVKEAFTPLPKVIVTFDEPVSLMTGRIFFIQVKKPDVETITERDLPPGGFIDIIDGIPSRETRERWNLAPAHSLPPGFYVVELKATDMVGNEATFRHFFSVDYETMDIRITRPVMGVSRQRDFVVEVSTFKNDAPVNTMCKYSRRDPKYRFFTLGMVSSNMFGPRHDFPSLPKEPFIDLTPNRRGNAFFLICQTPEGEVGQTQAEIYVDTEPPTITHGAFNPEVIVEIPDDHHFVSDLEVEANEDVQCKYALQGGLGFDRMTPFEGYNRDEFGAYKKVSTQPMELPEPQTRLSKIFFVRCEDRTGQQSQEVPVTVTIDLTEPIQIDVTSPPASSDNNEVSLNFTTSKIARCYYDAGNGSVFLEDEFNPSKTHSKQLGVMPDGRHTLSITCESTTAGTLQRSVKEHVFLIDSSPPPTPTFNGSTTSCDPNRFNLDIKVTADDPESGVPLFRYFVAETEKNGTFGARNGIGNLPRIDATPPETEETEERARTPAFSHTVIVSAINNVGIEGPAAPLILNYDPLHPNCIERDPPEVVLQKRSEPGKVDVTFVCDDESGCDENTFYYGLGGENLLGLANITEGEKPAESCTPSNLVDKSTPVEVRRTRAVCWKVKDTVGNEGEGNERVVVSLPQTCTNQVTDGDETGIDCGGSCGNLCEEGESCQSDFDCIGEYCVEGRCIPPKCDDLRENGDETDLDCGGLVCTRCDLNKTCERADDCTSSYCALSTKTCQIPTCADSAVNGNETDVDCGSSCPSKCLAGKACHAAEDCMSGTCTLGRCEAPAGPATPPPSQKRSVVVMVWKFIKTNLLFIIGILLIGGGAGYLAFSSPKPVSVRPALITPIMTVSKPSDDEKKRQAETARRRTEAIGTRRRQHVEERRTTQRGFFDRFGKAAKPIARAGQRPLALLRPFHAAARTGVQMVGRAAEKIEQLPQAIANGEWIPLALLQKKKEQPRPRATVGMFASKEDAVRKKDADEHAFEKVQDDVFEELERKTRMKP